MPAPGPVHVFKAPSGPGVRVDSGVQSGDEISGAFDSLLAKLIVTGATREEALERARRALEEFEVTGLPTVLPFHRAIVRDPAFAPEGGAPFSIYTRWIETEWAGGVEPWSGEAAAPTSPEERQSVVLEVQGKRVEVTLPSQLLLAPGTHTPSHAPKRASGRATTSGVAQASGNAITAPMQATVVKIAVEEGAQVVKGDLVVVLEAMKMEQPLTAHKDGRIEGINAAVGATVSSGTRLLNIV
jgi:acetyl-CoA/propionyl-CoA carboxylase biotin carboxyl carrier protein